jgi:signal transduction histidine kinase
MTLRRKAFFIVGGTALALLVALSLAGRRIILTGAAGVEEETITLDVLRVADAFQAELDRLEASCGDWAAWDDSYRFVSGQAPAFPRENLQPQALRTLRVNLIAFFDASGALVGGQEAALEPSGAPPGLLRALAATVAADPRLLGFARTRKGILEVGGQHVLLAALPVVHSDRSGPPRGALVFGRLLDAEHIARLARITHLQARVFPLAGADLPAALRADLARISATAPVVVRPVSGMRVTGYTVLEDLLGRPALVLAVEELRAIHHQAVRSLSTYMGALVASVLVFGALVTLGLEREVLSRLRQLGARVGEIGRAGDATQRVGVGGSDEIAHLAGEVDAMLARLEEAQTGLRAARDELEARVRERTGELEEANASLRGQVHERHRAEEALRGVKEELERQNVELRKLDRMKDALIGDVSHELRTPVAKHAMQLELLRRELERRGLGVELGEVLGVMEGSVRRQQSVIGNILALARIEGGGGGREPAPVRVDRLIEEVVAEYRPTLDACRVAVVLDLPAVTLLSDRELLWHVFSNLLGNAIKYRARVQPRVEVTATAGPDHLVVRISDNGVGFPAGVRGRLFERFYQESASVEGIGIGLHLVKTVLERLGGEIAIDSPGRGLGAVAEVRLPLRPPGAPGPDRAQPGAES